MLLRSVLCQNARFLSTNSAVCAISEAAVKKQDYYKNINQTQKDQSAKPAGWEDAKPFDSIPGPKPLPLIGNAFRFLPMGEYYKLDFTKILERIHNQYGDIALMKSFNGSGRNFLYLLSPEYIEMLFRNDEIWPHRQGNDGFDYYRRNVRSDVFGGAVGLISSQGEEWFKARTIINPILMQPRSVELYVDKIDTIASELIENMKYFMKSNPQGEMPTDFSNELNKWSLESISVVALNTRIGCLARNLQPDSQEQQFINNVLEFFELIYKIEILPSLWRVYSTPTWKRFVEVLDYLTFTILKYVEKAKIDNQGQVHKDERDLSMIERLVKIDKKIAIAMAIDMLQAGVDTTSKTLAAILYYLAKNPEVQKRVREESFRLLPDKESKVTKETLKDALYVKAVIKESNRLSPVAFVNLRTTTKDRVIAGYQIPKGTQVLTGNFVISRSEKYFPRSKEFIPERWLRATTDELSHKNVHPFVSLPFGFGARSCVGQRVAIMELETAILKIMRNFEICWPHEDAVFKTTAIHGITSPLKYHLKEVDK